MHSHAYDHPFPNPCVHMCAYVVVGIMMKNTNMVMMMMMMLMMIRCYHNKYTTSKRKCPRINA